MKLTMNFASVEASTLHILESELKRFDANISTHNGETTVVVDVDQKQYAELLLLVSCFDPYEVRLRQ